jgi:hypothetical protein
MGAAPPQSNRPNSRGCPVTAAFTGHYASLDEHKRLPQKLRGDVTPT